jgi:drug/metabolite transporter (DMT)-like permease
LWYSGVKQVQGSTAAGFMGVMPVSALVLSYMLLGEAFDPVHLVGFGLVFSGVLLIVWQHAQHAQHHEQQASEA